MPIRGLILGQCGLMLHLRHHYKHQKTQGRAGFRAGGGSCHGLWCVCVCGGGV